MKNIPNCLTVLNLLTGLAAIVFLIRTDRHDGELVVAALIALGGIIDFFDGYAARRLNAASDFGKQLDSFADLTTFGIAPVCLVHAVCDPSIFITISSALFLIASIYRLARYNINDFSAHFVGLPITAAGILLGVYCAALPLWANNLSPGARAAVTTAFILLLSAMMVSRVKVRRAYSNSARTLANTPGRTRTGKKRGKSGVCV